MLHGRKFGVTFSIVVSIAAVRRRRSNRRAARERRHRDATAAPHPHAPPDCAPARAPRPSPWQFHVDGELQCCCASGDGPHERGARTLRVGFKRLPQAISA